MLPRVILHTAMSLDGRITNFPADLDLYYTLAARWNPDAILFGSETVLAAVRDNPSLEIPPEHDEIFRPPENTEPDPRPLLVIADSRGRVRAGTLSASGLTCGASWPSALLQRFRNTSVTWPKSRLAPSLPVKTGSICALHLKH